jgi:photosystem II stability/assembly factor-like uncharacterized protein
MTRRRSLCAAALVAALLAPAAPAQTAAPPATLYIGAIQSKGYVVGSALTASGLQRHDGAGTWTHLGWNTPRISGIAVDPARPDTMYLASGNGVLRTFDGGAQWRVTNDWRITEVQDVAVEPGRPSHVYLASAYGVWRSTDHADSWVEANSGLLPPGNEYTETIEADRTRPGRVLVGTQDGVFVSTDGALSWRRAGGAGYQILDLNQSAADPQVWIAATYRRGLLLSADGGETWRPGPRALAGSTIHAAALDPFDARRMVAAGWGTGVHVSTNGGRTWRRARGALPTDQLYETIFDATVPGRVWVATLEAGVFRSDDLGRTWQPEGLDGTLVFDMLFVPTR